MKIRNRIIYGIAVIIMMGACLSCDSMLGDWLDTPSGERDVIWKNVGYEWGTGTLSWGQGGPVDPRLFSDGSSLYASWLNASDIMIYKYNGDDSNPNWSPYVSWFYGGASECACAFYQGRLFLLFCDGSNIYTNSFDPGIGWFSDDPLSYSTGVTTLPSFPRLVEHNGFLYAQWKEADRVRVKRYDGISWQPADVDPDGVAGIAEVCNGPDLHSSGDLLYSCLWRNSAGLNYVFVYEFEEPSGMNWAPIGSSINYNGAGSGNPSDMSFTTLQGRPYAMWVQSTGPGPRLTVSTRDQFGWWLPDGNYDYGFGLNFSASTLLSNPKLVTINERVCGFWLENDGAGGPLYVRGRLVNEMDPYMPEWLCGGYWQNNVTMQGNSAQQFDAIAFNSRVYIIFIEDTDIDLEFVPHVHVKVGY